MGRETYDARFRRSGQWRGLLLLPGGEEFDLLKRGHAELILFLHHESLALFVVEIEFLHCGGFGRPLVRRIDCAEVLGARP